MKKKGILNTPLSRLVASMGYTDKLVICDSGLLEDPRKAINDAPDISTKLLAKGE